MTLLTIDKTGKIFFNTLQLWDKVQVSSLKKVNPMLVSPAFIDSALRKVDDKLMTNDIPADKRALIIAELREEIK